MLIMHTKEYSRETLRNALNNLLKQKGYHQAAPTLKNKMLMRECAKIHSNEKKRFSA
jgi:hypothetical protein